MKMYLKLIKKRIRYNDIVNPNITSNVEFHNRYNIIIIPLIEQDQISIITDIIKKKLSKHKKNLIKRFRWIIIPITLPNVKINIIDNIINKKLLNQIKAISIEN